MVDTVESRTPGELNEVDQNIADAKEEMRNAQWPRAQVLLKDALRAQPGHVEANYLMGACLMEYGDPDNGLEYFTKIGEYRLEKVAEYIKASAPQLNVTVEKILELMPQREALANFYKKTEEPKRLPPGVLPGALHGEGDTAKEAPVRPVRNKAGEEPEEERAVDTDRLFPRVRHMWLASLLAVLSFMPPVPYEVLRGYLSFLPEISSKTFADLVPSLGKFGALQIFITGWGIGQFIALRISKTIYMLVLAVIFHWLYLHGTDIQGEILNYPYPEGLVDWISISTWGTMQSLLWYFLLLLYVIGLAVVCIVSAADAFIIWFKRFLVAFIVEIKNKDDVKINVGHNYFIRVGDKFTLFSHLTGKRKGAVVINTVKEKTALIEFRPDSMSTDEEMTVPKVGDLLRGA
jgi:hypothetical protein